MSEKNQICILQMSVSTGATERHIYTSLSFMDALNQHKDRFNTEAYILIAMYRPEILIEKVVDLYKEESEEITGVIKSILKNSGLSILKEEQTYFIIGLDSRLGHHCITNGFGLPKEYVSSITSGFSDLEKEMTAVYEANLIITIRVSRFRGTYDVIRGGGKSTDYREEFIGLKPAIIQLVNLSQMAKVYEW